LTVGVIPIPRLLYRDAIQAPYAVAYTVKFAVKRNPDGVDFTAGACFSAPRCGRGADET
jgi:hypothetical protein